MYIHLEKSRDAVDGLGLMRGEIPRTAPSTLPGYLAGLLKSLGESRRNMRVQADRAAFNDHMLADIGLTRADLAIPSGSAAADLADARGSKRRPMVYGFIPVLAMLTFAATAAHAGEGNGDPFPYRAPSLVFPDGARQAAQFLLPQPDRAASTGQTARVLAQRTDQRASEPN